MKLVAPVARTGAMFASCEMISTHRLLVSCSSARRRAAFSARRCERVGSERGETRTGARGKRRGPATRRLRAAQRPGPDRGAAAGAADPDAVSPRGEGAHRPQSRGRRRRARSLREREAVGKREWDVTRRTGRQGERRERVDGGTKGGGSGSGSGGASAQRTLGGGGCGGEERDALARARRARMRTQTRSERCGVAPARGAAPSKARRASSSRVEWRADMASRLGRGRPKGQTRTRTRRVRAMADALVRRLFMRPERRVLLRRGRTRGRSRERTNEPLPPPVRRVERRRLAGGARETAAWRGERRIGTRQSRNGAAVPRPSLRSASVPDATLWATRRRQRAPAAAQRADASARGRRGPPTSAVRRGIAAR